MLQFLAEISNRNKWRVAHQHPYPRRQLIKKLRLWPFNYAVLEVAQYHPLGLHELLRLEVNTNFVGAVGQRFALNITVFGVIVSLRVEDIRQFIWDGATGKYRTEDDNEQLRD